MEQLNNLMFVCEDCKKRIHIAQDQAPNLLKHKEEFISNGQSIFLTYYDCPHCGRRHFVQIDDGYSLQRLVRVKNEFRSLMAKRQKGKSIPKKQSERFKKSRQDLSEYRTNLMKEFTGKIAIDASGVEYALRFSV